MQKGHLVDQSLAEFKKEATDPVTGHFLLLQAFMPYLQMRKGTVMRALFRFSNHSLSDAAVLGVTLQLTGPSEGVLKVH